MRATEDLGLLGLELRRRREGLGLSLADMANRANLTPNYIGGIERGERDPSVSTLLALARGLGCHAADLLGGTPELSAPAVEAARLFDGAPVDVQDVTLQTLRRLGKRTVDNNSFDVTTDNRRAMGTVGPDRYARGPK